MRIIEIVATRCQILGLQCTKFDFGWSSAPDPAREACSAPPDFVAALKGPTSRGREGQGMGDERRGNEWEVPPGSWEPPPRM